MPSLLYSAASEVSLVTISSSAMASSASSVATSQNRLQAARDRRFRMGGTARLYKAAYHPPIPLPLLCKRANRRILPLAKGTPKSCRTIPLRRRTTSRIKASLPARSKRNSGNARNCIRHFLEQPGISRDRDIRGKEWCSRQITLHK